MGHLRQLSCENPNSMIPPSQLTSEALGATCGAGVGWEEACLSGFSQFLLHVLLLCDNIAWWWAGSCLPVMGWQVPFVWGGRADLAQPSLTSPELQALIAGGGLWPSSLRHHCPWLASLALRVPGPFGGGHGA